LPVDRNSVIAAAQIPQCVVDAADRHDEETGARECRFEERSKIFPDDDGRIAFDGPVEAVETGFGADAKIDRLGDDLLIPAGFVVIFGGAQIVVDVQRIDLMPASAS